MGWSLPSFSEFSLNNCYSSPLSAESTGQRAVVDMQWHPDESSLLLSLHSGGLVHMWDISSGRKVQHPLLLYCTLTPFVSSYGRSSLARTFRALHLILSTERICCLSRILGRCTAQQVWSHSFTFCCTSSCCGTSWLSNLNGNLPTLQ